MRDGHYTASDVNITVHPATKKEARYAVTRTDDGVELMSIAGHSVFLRQQNTVISKEYVEMNKVPAKYRVVARLVMSAARGHGGKRRGAGRPSTGAPMRQPRTFRLTDEEYLEVKEFIAKLCDEAKQE